jgi:hypothetical protein
LAAFCVTASIASMAKAAESDGPAAARVFAADSFWYKPIPADAPRHPKSAEFVQEFLRQDARVGDYEEHALRETTVPADGLWETAIGIHSPGGA